MPSLDELCRYTIAVQNAEDAVIIEGRQHPFERPRLAIVEQNGV